MLAAISVMNQLYDKPNLTSVGKPPVDTILFSLALFFCFFICGGKCWNHIVMTWLSTYHWAGNSEDPWFRKKLVTKRFEFWTNQISKFVFSAQLLRDGLRFVSLPMWLSFGKKTMDVAFPPLWKPIFTAIVKML